ncbi:hypothetical protein FQN57_002135 [Myotisia sp. PD_48]|nr:hypothetical protein FQN57_002135 [Myotisia sp. PD_48]
MKPPSPLLLRSLRSSIYNAFHHPAPCTPLPNPALRCKLPIRPNLRTQKVISRSYTQSKQNNDNIRPHQYQPSSPNASPSRRRTSLPYTHHQPSPSRTRALPKDEQDTKPATDLSSLDVLANVDAPATSIDACLEDGFQLNNGVKITDGDGCLLVGGEVFIWRPWNATTTSPSSHPSDSPSPKALLNSKGQWEVSEDVWGLLKLLWPKPDLLILGLGGSMHPVSPETRRHINELGIRIEVQDTRNAAAQFNLLATERGVQEIAAAMVPIGC